MTERRLWPLILVLTVAATGAVLLSIGVGQVGISPDVAVRIIGYRLFGVGEPTWTVLQDDIVWNLRLPRALLSLVVGVLLSLAGVLVQTMVRNPLADPWLLGISQGASVGAVAFIVLGVAAFGVPTITVAATLGAMLAFLLVFAVVQFTGSQSTLRVILAGVAIGYGLQSVVSFLLSSASDPSETSGALFWLMGSVAGARWEVLAVPFAVAVAGLVLAMGRANAMNALLLGDESATAGGVNVPRFRLELLAVASALTGAAVAVSGAIGFVGLIVPHAVRLLIGGDHRRLIPTAMLAGALFLTFCDVLSRVALDSRELSLGVITGLIGAPLLVLLLARRSTAGG